MDESRRNACPTSFTLRSFADGMLSDSQATEFVAHMERCPVCRKIVSNYLDEGDFVAQLRVALLETTAPEFLCLTEFQQHVLSPFGMGASSPSTRNVPPRQIGGYRLINKFSDRINAYRATTPVGDVQLDIYRHDAVSPHDLLVLESFIRNKPVGVLPINRVEPLADFVLIERPLFLGISAKQIVDADGPLALPVACQIVADVCHTLVGMASDQQKLFVGSLAEILLTTDGPLLTLNLARETTRSLPATVAQRAVLLLMRLLGERERLPVELPWRLRWSLWKAMRQRNTLKSITRTLASYGSRSQTLKVCEHALTDSADES